MSPSAMIMFLLNCGLALLVGGIMAFQFTASELHKYPGAVAVFSMILLLPVLNGAYILAHLHNRLAGLRVLRLWRLWLDAKERDLLEKSPAQVHPSGSTLPPPNDDRMGSPGITLLLLNLVYVALILIDAVATQELPYRSGDDVLIPWLFFLSSALVPILTSWYIASDTNHRLAGFDTSRADGSLRGAEGRKLQERPAPPRRDARR